MADFVKYSMKFESAQPNTADRKQVGSPPGHEPNAGREVVRESHAAHFILLPLSSKTHTVEIMHTAAIARP